MEQTSKVLEDQIRENITPSGGLSLDELADEGHPLGRGSKFKPSTAGLDKPYQIIRQSGALLRALGTEKGLAFQGSGYRAYVGFDHTGRHVSRTVSGRTRSVDMNDLLSWLINGTPVLVGRPVLVNSLADAVANMRKEMEELGLRRIRVDRVPRRAVDR